LPKESMREDSIRLFREDKDRNIIICNKKSGGSGISLHGTEKRWQFISPAFDALEQYQSTGRCVRQGDIGPVYMRFVYADLGELTEERILENLSMKNLIMTDLLDKQRAAGFLLPSQIESDKIAIRHMQHVESPSVADLSKIDRVFAIMTSRLDKQVSANQIRKDKKNAAK
jgi:hypothetical protein